MFVVMLYGEIYCKKDPRASKQERDKAPVSHRDKEAANCLTRKNEYEEAVTRTASKVARTTVARTTVARTTVARTTVARNVIT